MTDVKPKVDFEPVQPKTGGEWHVQATLPSGKQCMLGGFNTLAEAMEWIARKSSSWLKLKQCEGSRNG